MNDTTAKYQVRDKMLALLRERNSAHILHRTGMFHEHLDGKLKSI